MNLQALLVSSDNEASDVLARVLPGLGIAMDRASNAESAVASIERQRFDALLLDFDDPDIPAHVLQEARRVNSGKPPLTVALIADPAKVRQVLSGGAHFVLHKPLSEEKAEAGLRAVAALLNRERRRACRISVQAPVDITGSEAEKIEGILLDVSETGLDVLTAEQQAEGCVLKFRFKLPGGALEIETDGRVAWANANGQTGVQFVDLPDDAAEELRRWVKAASTGDTPDSNEIVPHCKLSDLSLGGCYVETNAPFPEQSLVDLCLKTSAVEVHTEGMVRVTHPGYGMGVEFPSRTAEQRAQVGNLIDVLRTSPDATPELSVSPRALVADPRQFEREASSDDNGEDMEDPLLELLRRGSSLQQDEFLSELHQQRHPQDVASV